MGKQTKPEPFFELTKAMQTLTDLTTKLLKAVTTEVQKSRYDLKFSYEKENVVKASGEGRYFVQPGGAMGAAKNVVLEPLASARGVAAFLHNVFIVHQ